MCAQLSFVSDRHILRTCPDAMEKPGLRYRSSPYTRRGMPPGEPGTGLDKSRRTSGNHMQQAYPVLWQSNLLFAISDLARAGKYMVPEYNDDEALWLHMLAPGPGFLQDMHACSSFPSFLPASVSSSCIHRCLSLFRRLLVVYLQIRTYAWLVLCDQQRRAGPIEGWPW